ncbi:MAG TPA: heme-binding protein [Ktedonobacteraceae bacterium]|nr:heme-binding protein [Ktedonobacteraceae bacterium]
MSIDVARKILEASKQRAKELRSPVSIAIVDSGGHLVLFERMMSPYGWATGNISIAKATTAVMFNQSTDSVAQWGAGIPGFASSLATMTEGKFIMAAGGWPIKLNGATIGGIGVSGGNAPGRDDEIARAGLGALEAFAPPVPAQPPQLPQQAQPVPQALSQHSRPYMQPTPSYPSMPPANSFSNPPANSGSFSASASNSGGLANPPSSSGVEQQQQQPNGLGTQHLFPDQKQEDNPYGDQNAQSYDNRSGGQS